MSVLIKGMEMPPKGLQETVLLTHNKATVNSARAWKGYKEFEAVSVPPHGDLIYREALIAAICSRLCIKDLTYLSPAEKTIVDEINYAPVVIPASADYVNDFTVAEEETLQLTNRGKMCEVFGEKDTYEMFAPAGWWDKIYRKPAEEGENTDFWGEEYAEAKGLAEEDET